MEKKQSMYNRIFRDIVLGVLLLVSALVMAFTVHIPGAEFSNVIISSILAVPAVLLLYNAVKKDKYRLELFEQ